MVAGAPTGPVEVPDLVRAFAENIDDVVWANEIGGYTFVAGDRFLKWNPLGSGVDLEDERARLVWARTIGHPVPQVLEMGRDDFGQVLITRGLTGSGAVSGEWLERPQDAVRAIAAGTAGPAREGAGRGLPVPHAVGARGCARPR